MRPGCSFTHGAQGRPNNASFGQGLEEVEDQHTGALVGKGHRHRDQPVQRPWGWGRCSARGRDGWSTVVR